MLDETETPAAAADGTRSGGGPTMNLRQQSVAQTLVSALAMGGQDGEITIFAGSTRVHINAWVDFDLIAQRLREAFTARDVTDLTELPDEALVVDHDRDILLRDDVGWYYAHDPDGADPTDEGDPEALATFLPALIMPWRWEGDGAELRAVDVPTASTPLAPRVVPSWPPATNHR